MNILLAFAWSPYTTAAYYAKAFRAMGHDVRTVGPSDAERWASWPGARRYRLTGPHYSGEWGEWGPGVCVWIDAGGDWCADLRDFGAPTIGYFIDSHSRLAQHVQNAPLFDKVFVAHRQYVDRIPGAEWLPVACDPDVHTPTVTGEPLYDVAFVGNTYGGAPMYAERRRLLATLRERYKLRAESGMYFEGMANVYASARVAFNVSTGGDLNMRVFEAMCSGTPLVTDTAPGSGLLDLFGYLEHLLVYFDNSPRCLWEQIDILLSSRDAANRIAAAGRAEVVAHHTYAHRAAQMLAAL